MTHLINNIYTFDNEYETVLDLRTNNIIPPNNQNNNIQLRPALNPSLIPWRPSSKLQRLYDKF